MAGVRAGLASAAVQRPDDETSVRDRPAPVVHLHRILGAVVLTPQGVFDATALHEVDRAVADASAETVVLDLSACALTHTAVLERLEARRWARTMTAVRVVCPRRSARRLLARAGVASRLSLFQSIEEAMAADG